MNAMIAWMKSNLAVVGLSAIIVVSLPAAYIGSSMWNSGIRTARQDEATRAMRDLEQLRISYVLPAPLPREQGITVSREAPHEAMTAFFREHREALEGQLARVVEAARQINAQGHEVLVEGLFPVPEHRLKPLELVEVLVGRDGRPSVYTELFRKINAGGPADPVRLVGALSEHESRFVGNIQATTMREQLTDEEQETLIRELAMRRLGAYQDRAQEISVYAGMDVLPREVPTSVPQDTPSVEQCFRWQFDYWTIADLLRAVDNANTVDRVQVPVDQAVVKRIERISLSPLVPDMRGQEMGGTGTQPRARVNPITGRSGGPENQFFDVRNARLTVIVSSARLPELINAISRTNFMTVIGMNLEEVDVWADLEQGYYYGREHVVRATLDIETVWLRNWTAPLMPPTIRRVLTGSDGTTEGGAAGGDGW